MIRALNATFASLVRLLLVLGLAFMPLAQPMALANLAKVADQTATAPAGGCPHHAQAEQAPDEPAVPGQCCCQKGVPCHCAMAVALPTPALPALSQAVSDHPVSAPRFTSTLTPPPEPPPPRG